MNLSKPGSYIQQIIRSIFITKSVYNEHSVPLSRSEMRPQIHYFRSVLVVHTNGVCLLLFPLGRVRLVEDPRKWQLNG